MLRDGQVEGRWLTADADIPIITRAMGAAPLADPTTRRDGNPYGEWIAAYTSESYRGVVRDAVAMLDRLAKSHNADTRYRSCSSPS